MHVATFPCESESDPKHFDFPEFSVVGFTEALNSVRRKCKSTAVAEVDGNTRGLQVIASCDRSWFRV